MTEDVAAENARKASMFVRAAADNLIQILLAIAEMVEKNSDNELYKEMARWIKKNKGQNCVTIYPIQGNCYEQLIYELDKQNIPYLILGNNKKILIKNQDYQLIKELNRQVLIEKSNYYQDVNAIEMEDAIANIDRIKNKDILTVKCMDEIEAEVLKNKCGSIAAGFMVGTEKAVETDPNGRQKETCTLSVHGAKVLTADENRQHFCKAYLQMAFSLYGPNSTAKRQQVEANKMMEDKIAKLKGIKQPVYLVSACDNTKFIEFNSGGFEYYETYLDKEGKRCNKQSASCFVNDPDYEVKLQKHTEHIYGKTLIYNRGELTNYLADNQRNFNTEYAIKNKKEYEINLLESRLTDKINEMIKTKLFHEKDMNSYNPAQKFELYRIEVLEIMSAMVRDIPPKGYSEEDFDYMMEMIYDSEQSFETGYLQTMNRINTVEVETHKAQKRNKIPETGKIKNSTQKQGRGQ